VSEVALKLLANLPNSEDKNKETKLLKDMQKRITEMKGRNESAPLQAVAGVRTAG